MQIFLIIICAVLGYLIGSLNFALITCKVLHKEDIRNLGSKNAGMTNMLRIYGKGPAAMTLAGDLCKGVIAILLARLIFFLLHIEEPVWVEYIIGMTAALGHSFPVFYGFRGGKGVLICIGILLLLSPLPALATFAVFAIVLGISKTVSISSMIAAVTAPFWIWMFGALFLAPDTVTRIICTAILAVFIVGMHWSNIVRIIHGEEHSFRKKDKE